LLIDDHWIDWFLQYSSNDSWGASISLKKRRQEIHVAVAAAAATKKVPAATGYDDDDDDVVPIVGNLFPAVAQVVPGK